MVLRGYKRPRVEEECLDLEGRGGTGVAKDCSSGEELRGDGAAPIQQVQGWDLKKDR